MRAKRYLKLYQGIVNRTNFRNPLIPGNFSGLTEVKSLFDADFVAVNVPDAGKWRVHKYSPDAFELDEKMLFPLWSIKSYGSMRQFRGVDTRIYECFGLPKFTVILQHESGDRYHLPPGIACTKCVRDGVDVIGLAQFVHPDVDAASNPILVPMPVRCPWCMSVSFMTSEQTNGFFDPNMYYISVKTMVDPPLGIFLTEAFRS